MVDTTETRPRINFCIKATSLGGKTAIQGLIVEVCGNERLIALSSITRLAFKQEQENTVGYHKQMVIPRSELLKLFGSSSPLCMYASIDRFEIYPGNYSMVSIGQNLTVDTKQTFNISLTLKAVHKHLLDSSASLTLKVLVYNCLKDIIFMTKSKLDLPNDFPGKQVITNSYSFLQIRAERD